MQRQLLAQFINTAHAANGRGEYALAAGWCRQALQLAPRSPEACYNLGIALSRLGERPEAIDAFEKARIHSLDSADAQNSIGLELGELGALPEAEQCLLRSIELAPSYAFAHSNLGKLREKQRRLEDAEACFRKAIELQPALAAAHANLGGILNARKDHEAAEAACRKAVELDAKSPGGWSNLGSALHGMKRYEAAEAACREAIALDPKSSEAWSNLGSSLCGLGRHEAGAECLGRALELNPRIDFLFGELLHARMKICDWRSLADDLNQLVRKIDEGCKASSPFPVLSMTTDLAVQRKAAEIWVGEKCPEQADLGPIPKRRRHDKIRIGYYSADYHNHATTYLMADLFERHDKDKFEFFGFSFGPDSDDEMRRRVAAAFDRFIDVRAQSDEAVARLSRELEIDIAVDLKGYTENFRTGIFCHRAAPIQVSYLGYPGTMGAKYIDYLIADEILIPAESRRHYSEKIAYLPNSYQPNDARRRIADRIFGRDELGLPPAGFVFCCFNNNYKITPATFGVWMRLLTQVEHSVLWLFEKNPTAAGNLRNEAASRGIDPARLVFAQHAPLDEHLARHRVADLFIDTLPYNAHTAASDALWAGLPVLTCIGEAFASRVAASLLNAIGLPELIASTQAEYEAKAVELASDPLRLAQIRQKLDRHRLATPLFDIPAYTRHIEAAYTAMHERHLNGLPPEHIHVDQ